MNQSSYLKISFLSLILFASVLVLNAQEGTRVKANKLFESLAYSEAIELYERVLARDSADQEALKRLADCYRLTNHMEKARNAYEKIINLGIGAPLDKYYYAQSLMHTGNHQEALQYMEQFLADNRGTNYQTSLKGISDFYRDSANVKVKMASFNSNRNDFSPLILPDGKIVFASSRERTEWIKRTHAWTGHAYYYLYSVDKQGSSYSGAELYQKKLMRKYNNGPIAFNPSDSSLMLTANNVGVKDSLDRIRLILKEYKYDNKKGKYHKKPIPFPYNHDQYNVAHAAFSANGNILFFSSDMPGTLGGMDLWYSIKIDSVWSAPQNLGSTYNTAGNEVFPALTGKALYYSSDGLSGLGGLDLYEADLDETGLPRSIPKNLGYPLNTGSDDFGITFWPDANKGFFTSNRSGLDANDDIYEFQIVHRRAPKLMIAGVVKDKETGELLPGSVVTLRDHLGNWIGQVNADAQGAYSFMAEFNQEYVLDATSPAYYQGYTSVDPVIKKNEDVIVRTQIELEKDPGTILRIEVRDEKTTELIPGALVRLLDYSTLIEEELVCDENGMVSYSLIGARKGKTMEFAANYSAKGYFAEDHPISIKITDEREIKIVEYLIKPEVGMDLGKIVQINPIYFDLDKSNIRPDAALELEKIVKLMLEYPNMVVELGSHTDCRASKAYNEKLSDRRAKSSAAYIISKGVDRSRIYGKGYGERMLVNGCECEGKNAVPCSEDEHQLNRRTEFVIVRLE